MANKVTIESALCKGCRLCVSVCPKKILELDMNSVNAKGYNPVKCIDMSICTACAMCARICPDSVLRIEKDV